MPHVAPNPLSARPSIRFGQIVVITFACMATMVGAAPVAPTGTNPGNAPVSDNPLRTADEATRQAARAEAWLTFQRTCRPCHGNLGGGDGPYAFNFAERASDVRRASREVATDAVRFTRIRDGAASRPTRPWESAMPAFGGELEDREIWGLVLLLDDFAKDASGLDPSATAADVYAVRCAACHGATGKGDGPLAAELLPAPRDFVKANYRFRSTEEGAAPLDTDLIGSTARGLGVTSMGKMLGIGGNQIEDMAKFLMTFAPDRFASPPPIPPASKAPAGTLAEIAARGRDVYVKAGCAECHGATGRGNGPAAATLTDDTGRPSMVTDLTKRWHYKGGVSAAEVYRTLTNGMNGTPMKSFATDLSSDDRWALAHHLERNMPSRPRFTPTLIGLATKDAVPTDPNAELWQRIPPTPIPLGPQVEVPPYWTQPAIDVVYATALSTDRELAILLAWNDPTRSVDTGDERATSTEAAFARHGKWRLPDRIAIQFPEKVDPKGTLPPLYLGDATRPVVRWSWSADRAERGEHTAVVERVAGPTAAPVVVTDAPPVQTTAAYVDGQWRVLVVTKRPPASQKTLAFALHGWEGSHGESGSWQSLSSWITLDLR
jgi:DMSO reductase family type II enzyme heme b subunit